MKLPVAIILSVVAGAGGFWAGMQWNSVSRQPTAGPSAVSAPPRVTVAEVATTLFPEILIRPGEVVADRRYKLAPRVAGRLEKVFVRPGDRIAAGVDVATLSAPELKQAMHQAQAELRSAQTELADAQADVNRLSILAKTHAISEDTLRDTRVRRDRAHAAVSAAEAVVVIRKVDLSELRLRAPESLIVLERLREPGDLIGPELPVIEAESAQSHRFETWVPLSNTARLRQGMPIKIFFQRRTAAILGHLSQVVPAADPVTRSCKIEIDLPADAALISGEYGDAHIIVGQSPTLAVPLSVLKTQTGVIGSFVVGSDGRARYRSVRTGRRLDGQVEILAGLEPGDRIIIDLPSGLTDGAPVEIRSP